MARTPQEFADRVNELASDPARAGSQPHYGVELAREPYGYVLKMIGSPDRDFIRECYAIAYYEGAPSPGVLRP
ncbi:hypothetical protein [uncultured Oxalicibacterium sp.]|uniref:hypothetical protein n=1 Tax=uncultured Oxalicibacterium sp. TaxID=1168540 RepID=UPI0025E08C99|nr:hypothetical protein [uncultured Oxalicibacterium sp.]